jgi:hypothetical protein
VPLILPDLLFITAGRQIGTVYLTSTVLALFHKICTQAYKNQRIILKVIKRERERDTDHGKKAARCECFRLKYGF